MTNKKTYKREVSMILFAFLGYMCVRAVNDIAALEVVKIITAPVFIFALGSFGLDSAAKQFGDK